MTRHALVVWLERLLMLVGAVCLGWYGYATASAAAFQQEERARFERDLMLPPIDEPPALAGVSDSDTDGDPVLGLIEIPRLGLEATVMSGDDESVLSASAGHLPDTPRPWEAGNSAIAAHRDGLFRPLRHIRRGDVIRLRTRRGDLDYRVDETKIVEPSDLSVLAPRRTDSVTLITCYPFNFVGSAPQRFIVHAARVGGHAAPPGGVLPSRSLAVVTGHRAAPQRLAGSPAASSRAAVAARGNTPRARARLTRAPRVSSGHDRRARRAASASQQREQAIASRDRRSGSSVTRNAGSKSKAERPAKTRRWYHFFRRK
jgi:LPXTG-site transpeptidase (sortase) family protein